MAPVMDLQGWIARESLKTQSASGVASHWNVEINEKYVIWKNHLLFLLPAGPTANLSGLKLVDVNTDDVRDDRADVISGELPCVGGRRPKDENNEGGPGIGPGLDMGGCDVFGVRSKAPKEFDSDGVGLPTRCDDGGRGTFDMNDVNYVKQR